MFESILEELERMNGKMEYRMDVLPDAAGYYDKECPNEDCLSKFKVNAEDWRNLFSDEAVYCPFCGHFAPARSWRTTEQIEQAKEQAFQQVKARIGQALDRDCREFNRHQRKGFITMSMKFSGTTYAPNLPAAALEEMEQRITCENCGARYAVIGSAFYCPCCGHNSAKQTFFNTIEKVKAKINNLERVRLSISQFSKDEAARTCNSLIETSVPDLVVALQRLCECVYPQLPNAVKTKKNVFQRLDDGNKLWHDATGQGYSDWITDEEYALLKKCFQRRHVLQHKDGIVDQEYIDKSGDTSYLVGQHLIINKAEIIVYADIVVKIGQQVIDLLPHKTEPEAHDEQDSD